jgi:hypothetical protein
MEDPGSAEQPAPPTETETEPTADSNGIVSPLSRIPLDIAHHRAALFALETPVQFDQKAWDRYWPYAFRSKACRK